MIEDHVVTNKHVFGQISLHLGVNRLIFQGWLILKKRSRGHTCTKLKIKHTTTGKKNIYIRSVSRKNSCYTGKNVMHSREHERVQNKYMPFWPILTCTKAPTISTLPPSSLKIPPLTRSVEVSNSLQCHCKIKKKWRDREGSSGRWGDMSCPRKLFLTQRRSHFSGGSLFFETSAYSLASLSGS